MSGPQEHEKPVPIISEEIEPFAAMLIGRMWSRCEQAKKLGCRDTLEHACASFWMVRTGLEKIAVGVSTATHFSIAMNNHTQMIATYIEEAIGVNPIRDQCWRW